MTTNTKSSMLSVLGSSVSISIFDLPGFAFYVVYNGSGLCDM